MIRVCFREDNENEARAKNAEYRSAKISKDVYKRQHYHGEYKDYANLLEISEKDAKKEIEEDFNESIQQQFDDSDNITRCV